MHKKIAIVGGHIAPALGFINSLPKEISVVYIGRKHAFEGDLGLSLEYKIITKQGIQFRQLTTGRLQRVFTKQTIPSLLKIPNGLLQGAAILREEKPDIVVGFGGYMSFPVGIAAKIMGIPLVLHESTLGAGFANRILASIADKICVSSDSSLTYFPIKKTCITGNPMLPFDNKNISDVLPVSREKLPLIVVVGGSAGSHAINQLIFGSLSRLLSFAKIVWQTGDAKEYHDFEDLQKVKAEFGKTYQERYTLTKFIDPGKVNTLYSKADIIISRAGFNTVTTLLLLKKKTILIPLPSGQKNEQMENAALLEQSGYGIICLQESLNSEKLIETIKFLLRKKVKETHFSIPFYANGGENLVKEVLKCLDRKRGK